MHDSGAFLNTVLSSCVYTMQPVVQPAVQQVVQRVASCIRGFILDLKRPKCYTTKRACTKHYVH